MIPYKDIKKLLFLWRKIEGNSIVFEVAFVGAVAKGLVLREATAADADYLAAGKAVDLAVAVYYFEISFDLYGTVAVDSELCSRHARKYGIHRTL